MSTERQKAQQKRWHEQNDGPKGTIGNVPKLAHGAINPVWAIQESLPAIAKRVAPFLRATEPKRPRTQVQRKNDAILEKKLLELLGEEAQNDIKEI